MPRLSSSQARRLYPWIPIKGLADRLEGGDGLALSEVPLVLYVWDYTLERYDGCLLPVFRKYRHEPVYLLVMFSWARENAWHVGQLQAWQQRHLKRHANHRIVFTSNSETQHAALSQAGLRSVFVNHNVVIDPDTFRPLSAVTKRHDAVYDARTSAFKRHELAAGIDSLALIAGYLPMRGLHDDVYTRRIRQLLDGAHWYNDPYSPDYRYLTPPEVNQALNECRVGLCLSAEEGAMRASMQYLLAGLPIVSTRSKGGRDAFFDPDYALVVDDDPQAIARAVQEMIGRNIPPETIRARTLEKIGEHKQRLFGLLDDIRREHGQPPYPRACWEAWEIGSLRNARNLVGADEIFRRIMQTGSALREVQP